MRNISEILNEDLIILNLKTRKKQQVIEELIDKICEKEKIKDKTTLLQAVKEREEIESTGIGMGIAIPHCRTNAVDKVMVAFGKSVYGVDYDTLDGKPAYLFFLIIAPESERKLYIRILARLSRLLRNQEFRRALREIITRAEVIELFIQAEK